MWCWPPLTLSFVTLAYGYTTFESNCSIPDKPANFVSSAGSRGTLDILWSCLFTILACTWTIQHLNVPEQREGRDPNWSGDIKWQLKRFWGITKWMLATIVAPEVLLGKAWGDLEGAKVDLEELQKFADEDGVPWTVTHSLFANMGGFVIRTNTDVLRGRTLQVDNGTQTDLGGAELNLREDGAQGLVSNSQVQLNSQPKRATPKLLQNYPNPYHLMAWDICQLRKAGLLARLPYITIEDIKDKSKSDSFSRTITIFQISWTMIQVIARAARHLAISQLEIAVLSFSVCGIIIYVLCWQKPKGVETPYTILQYRRAIPDEALWILKDRPPLENFVFSIVGDSLGRAIGMKKVFSGVFGLNTAHQLGTPVSNDDSSYFGARRTVGFIVGSAAFGALHIAAWNFIFPTRTEQIIWRATSLWCTLIYLIYVPLAEFFPDGDIANVSLAAVSFLYVLARLFLVVEIFRTLCFLPPDAYVATWASNIPHIS